MSQMRQNISTLKMPRRKVTSTKNDKTIDLQKISSNLTTQNRNPTTKNTWSLYCTRINRGQNIQWSNSTIYKNFKSRNEICNDFYIYDANYVKGTPIKNCAEDKFLRMYEEKYAELTNKGYCPKFNKIYNEFLKSVEAFIDTKIKIAICATCHSLTKCS